MKSKRRHELQQNTLAMELDRLREWLKRHGTRLATILLVAAVAVLVVVFLVRRARSAEAAEQRAFYDALQTTVMGESPQQAIEVLQPQAGQHAMAAVALGDVHLVLSMQSMYSGMPAEVAEQEQKASEWYEQVVNGFPEAYLAKAMARYGLSTLAKNRRQFAEARRQLEQARELEVYAPGQPVFQMVEQALMTDRQSVV